MRYTLLVFVLAQAISLSSAGFLVSSSYIAETEGVYIFDETGALNSTIPWPYQNAYSSFYNPNDFSYYIVKPISGENPATEMIVFDLSKGKQTPGLISFDNQEMFVGSCMDSEGNRVILLSASSSIWVYDFVLKKLSKTPIVLPTQYNSQSLCSIVNSKKNLINLIVQYERTPKSFFVIADIVTGAVTSPVLFELNKYVFEVQPCPHQPMEILATVYFSNSTSSVMRINISTGKVVDTLAHYLYGWLNTGPASSIDMKNGRYFSLYKYPSQVMVANIHKRPATSIFLGIAMTEEIHYLDKLPY